jgi:hypothetical protein
MTFRKVIVYLRGSLYNSPPRDSKTDDLCVSLLCTLWLVSALQKSNGNNDRRENKLMQDEERTAEDD